MASAKYLVDAGNVQAVACSGGQEKRMQRRSQSRGQICHPQLAVKGLVPSQNSHCLCSSSMLDRLHQRGDSIHASRDSSSLLFKHSWRPSRLQNQLTITARATNTGTIVTKPAPPEYETPLENPDNGATYSARMSQNGAARKADISNVYRAEVSNAAAGTSLQLDSRRYPLAGGESARIEVREYEDTSEKGDTFTKYSGYIFDQADGEANTWPEYDQEKIARCGAYSNTFKFHFA